MDLGGRATQASKPSANLYSLIMSAKYNNLDPYYYLAYVFKYLLRATTVAEIEKCLPWALH